jgi:hypothetical protein
MLPESVAADLFLGCSTWYLSAPSLASKLSVRFVRELQTDTRPVLRKLNIRILEGNPYAGFVKTCLMGICSCI